MPLFQTSVLKTYLAQQDLSAIDRAYKKYSKYFHNIVIQENIKISKEEQFQATFLTELFVNILDYTLNPKPDFNLTTKTAFTILGNKKILKSLKVLKTMHWKLQNI